jgi:hypothetical protein
MKDLMMFAIMSRGQKIPLSVWISSTIVALVLCLITVLAGVITREPALLILGGFPAILLVILLAILIAVNTYKNKPPRC